MKIHGDENVAVKYFPVKDMAFLLPLDCKEMTKERRNQLKLERTAAMSYRRGNRFYAFSRRSSATER